MIFKRYDPNFHEVKWVRICTPKSLRNFFQTYSKRVRRLAGGYFCRRCFPNCLECNKHFVGILLCVDDPRPGSSLDPSPGWMSVYRAGNYCCCSLGLLVFCRRVSVVLVSV